MMLTGEMRYLGLQSLLLLGWVCLACGNLQPISRMLFYGIPWKLESKCFYCLGEEEVEYEFSSSHVNLVVYFFGFPKDVQK